jgi:hypothetical protein
MGKPRLLLTRRLIWFAGFLFSPFPVLAENWVEYYRTGHGVPPNIMWDLNQVDLDSIARDGKLLRYRVRIKYAEQGPGPFTEMQVNCVDGTHG